MDPTKNRFNDASRKHAIPKGEGMQFLKAAKEGDLETVKTLLDKFGPEIVEIRKSDWINTQEARVLQSETETALMYAAYNNHKDIVELLIEKGADVNARMEEGHTVLMLAHGDDIRALLLKKGAELEGTNDDGWTPLLWPSWPGDLRFLLAQGANVHHRDNDGRTALILIAGDNYVHKEEPPSEHMKILLDAGIDVNVQGNEGETALIVAAARSAYDDDAHLKVKCLLDHGANPDIRDKEGKTAAMHARIPRPDLDAREDQQKAVAELLEQETERRAEKLRKLIVEGGDTNIAIFKPLQFRK
ncbi:MAG: hypothetical protein EPN97_01040 [Alphaproteobacteria bacterium]|nr:MAG: hypothetical protein EPN97_01040 [Alphaproteobacteria bacterium]